MRDRGTARRHRELAPAPRVVALAPPRLEIEGAPARAYRSLLGHARIARSLPTVSAVAAAAVAATFLARVVLTIDAVADASCGASVLDELAEVSDAATIIALTVLAITLAPFVSWSAAASRNVPGLALGHDRSWTAWSVEGWLLPGPNVVVPTADGEVVHRWWTTWLVVPSVAVLVCRVLAPDALVVESGRALDGLGAVAAVLLLAAIVSLHQIVGIVTVAQARRADLVAAELSRVSLQHAV